VSYDPRKQHRRSLGAIRYDDVHPGAGFVTTCTQHGERPFGNRTHRRMMLTDAEWMVQSTWEQSRPRFPAIGLDACAAMPNHLQAIVIFAEACLGVAPRARPLWFPVEATGVLAHRP